METTSILGTGSISSAHAIINPAAQSAQPAHCAAQPAQQPVTDFHDTDWSFPLHEQLNPRLYGHPPRNMAELNLRGARKESVAWTNQYCKMVFPGQSGYINVIDETNGSHVKVDLRSILALPNGSTRSSTRTCSAYGFKAGKVGFRGRGLNRSKIGQKCMIFCII